MSFIDTIGDALGDPDIKNQISGAFGDPKISARVLLFIAAITILARLRSIGKGKP